MNQLTPAQLQRLRELLTDERLDQLSFEERAELDELLELPGASSAVAPDVLGGLLARLYSDTNAQCPPGLRDKLLAQGERIIAAKRTTAGTIGPASTVAQRPVVVPAEPARRSKLPWLLAASLALAGWLGYSAWTSANAAKQARLSAQASRDETANVRKENQALLASAQRKADELAQRVADAQSRASELDKKLADAAAREVKLAQELATATKDLEAANLRIAKYEAPEDPQALAARRTKLLELPGTIRVAWKNFDLPDAPAEQQQVTGDVVWNDDLEEGYLRFVGLKPNDPKVEQYQVWVIDERGMEQKVSGGVFNATAQGEIYVPIKPGIDMRKVQLFAVTIEEPGGTWVPSLKRRVVVAPRGG